MGKRIIIVQYTVPVTFPNLTDHKEYFGSLDIIILAIYSSSIMQSLIKIRFNSLRHM